MIKKEIINVKNMFCPHCNTTIEKAVLTMEGIKNVKADYISGSVEVEYDTAQCSVEDIKKKIHESGYPVQNESNKNFVVDGISVVIIILAVWYILSKTGIGTIFQSFPEAKEGMGYLTIFLIGILTSIHCIAMCGGINISQSLGSKSTKTFRTSILYNAGRIVSYTVIGGLLGGIGSVIAISMKVRSAVGIIAGVVMLMMGMNMMGCFKGLKKFGIHLPESITRKLYGKKSHGSFYIGLINGFMPCGPLQSMQILAIASGSVVRGALSMFFFSIGTVPLMLGIGIFAGAMKQKFREKMVFAGAIVIMFFGLYTLNNNLALSGINFVDIHSNTVSDARQAVVDGNIQYITTELQPGSYETIKVKKDIPVKWTIIAGEGSLNGCNNEIIISEYNLDVKLNQGVNVIEFIPEIEGTIPYSCWMGMIKSSIIVEG